ncbi:hypothetical protein A4X09_0g7389, partial [Tilletia walkeri]
KTAGGLRKKRKSGNSVGDGSGSGSGMGALEDSSASTSASTSASASISPINGVKRKDPPLGSGSEGTVDVKRTALYAPGPPTGSSLVSPGSSALVGHQQGLNNREVVVTFGAPPNLLNQQGSSSLLPPNGNHVPVHPSPPLKTLPPPMFPHIALNPIFSLASTPTPALRILSSNPTLGILAGYNPREVAVEVPLGDLIAPEDVIFVEKMARDALSLASVRVEVEDGTAPSSSSRGGGGKGPETASDIVLPPNWVERTLNTTACAQMQLRFRHAYGFYDPYLVRVHVGPLPSFQVQDPRTHRGVFLVWTFLKLGNLRAEMPVLKV